MKIMIFAGGSGRRLWPLSRKSSPKQFEPIIGSRSTVQLAVERMLKAYDHADIFISTNQQYRDILCRQLPDLPADHLIGEPARRDLAAAVGLAATHLLHHFGPDQTMAIVWGDNYMTQTDTFLHLLASAEEIIVADRAEIVFVGETPRFANDQLGWIGFGDRLGEMAGQPYFAFDSWVYRPPLDVCQRMFDGGRHVWNTGYFVTTVGFIRDAYRQHQPELWAQLQEIGRAIGQDHYQDVLERIYPQLEVASFDDAIVQKLALDQAVVLHGRTGWSDPGTLYALKEAIDPDPAANVVKGLVAAQETRDSLVYNFEEDKLVAVVGLDGMVVVNMEDALLVVHKDQIPLVKELVNSLVGTELEKYG
jgi:mannose-1-phosphate guanylyltransferase